MSGIKEAMADDLEIFNQIYAEEKKNVPNRKTMGSAAVAQTALPATLVRFMNYMQTKTTNQGTGNARNKRNNSDKEKAKSTSRQ
jgi:hypothetical protein